MAEAPDPTYNFGYLVRLNLTWCNQSLILIQKIVTIISIWIKNNVSHLAESIRG